MLHSFIVLLNNVFGGWLGFLTLIMFIISLNYCTEKD